MHLKLFVPLIAIVLSLAAGCNTSPRWPDPERAASAATGSGGAIVLRTVGGPVDEGQPSPETLTQAEAIRRVLQTHPEIQAALARVRIAQAEAHQERLLPNPVLSVALRFVEGGGSPIVEAGLTAELLSLLQRKGRISAADQRLRAASAAVVTTVLDVVAELQERYVAIQALEATSPVLLERRQLTDQLLGLAESRLQAGEGTRLDLTTLRAQQVGLAIEAAEFERERRELRLQLARLIGQPSGEATWTLDAWSLPLMVADEASWVNAALEHRPEIQTRMWELAALGAEVQLSRWTILEGADAGLDSERDESWSVGPAVSTPLPIFDWGQAKRELAEARRLEAVHLLTEARRQAVEDIRRFFAAFQAASSAANEVRETLLPLLQQRREEAESIYRAGQEDILLVILADQELRTGRTRLIEAERRAAEAFVRLQRAVGGSGHMPAADIVATPPTTIPATQPLNGGRSNP